MLTLNSNLTRTVRLFGNRPAILDREGRFTWLTFSSRVARAAGVLQSLGVRQAQRFGIVCHNSFRNAELMHGGYWLGAVPVPVNFRLAPREIAYILDDAECRLVAVEEEFAHLFETRELAPWARRILTIGPGGKGDPRRQYDRLLDQTRPAVMFDDADEDADALIIYTGGTTGRAKGVRLSHRNILINAMQIGLEVRARAEDTYLHVAPMFHSADLLGNAYSLAGAAHLYMTSFSVPALLETIERYQISCTMLTPTMIVMVLQDPTFGRYDLSSLRQVIYGSSPLAAEWIRRALEAFSGVEFIQAYGLTETAPLLTMLSMADHQRALEGAPPELLKSGGRALVGVDLRIQGIDGREVPTGEPGEVVVRAPNVARGYLKQPEATAEAFQGDWFHTGDIGCVDADGYLRLLDRKKDMIITGGENVYSLEVEAALYEHPGVQECAVVGVPDEIYGETLLAAVVPAPGIRLSDEMLIAHCRDRIGGYKIPRRYVFLDELPKSAMNKVLKHQLRRRYGGQG
jgi:long-chain acyl-CoA synthetase